MNALSNKLLLKAYTQAKELHLEEHFVLMLQKEIKRRNLQCDCSLKIKS